jgi:hypothetical protein
MAPQYNRTRVMKSWAAGLLIILLINVASFAQTSTTFAIDDGGGVSFQTKGTATGGVAVGYAKVNPDSGAQLPSGLAIMDYRESNVLVSEAGVPASGLIKSGRIYAEISSFINTGVAIANPANQTATLTFFFTDSSGDFGSNLTTIPPNGHFSAFLNEAPFNGRSSLTGSFTFSSNIPISVVALRGRINERSEFLMTTLPVTDLSAAPSTGSVVFPHFAAGGGWTTQIVLVNPTDTTLTGGLEFRDPSGQVTNPFNSDLTYAIRPRSSFEMQASLASSAVLTGSVHINPTGDTSTPAGLVVFSFQNGGVTVSEAGVPAAAPGSAFRVFVESSGDFDHAAQGSLRTGLAVANTSPQATTAIVEVRNLDGGTGLIGTLSIPGNGQAALFLNQIPGIQTLLTPFRGMLELTSFAPITIIGLRARYNERNDLLMTTTPPADESVPPPASGLYFPHFADAGGFTTQFVLFSAQPGETTSGTLQLVPTAGGTVNVESSPKFQ